MRRRYPSNNPSSDTATYALVGGGVLFFGGLAYWLYAQSQPGPSTPSASNTAPSSGNAVADNLNAQWQALAQVVPDCLGASASLSSVWAPGLFSNPTWAADYQGWQEYYQGIGSFGWEDIVGDLGGWQAEANAWGEQVKAQCPNTSLPANFPTGPAGAGSIVPGLATLAGQGTPSSTFLLLGIAMALGIGLGIWGMLQLQDLEVGLSTRTTKKNPAKLDDTMIYALLGGGALAAAGVGYWAYTESQAATQAESSMGGSSTTPSTEDGGQEQSFTLGPGGSSQVLSAAGPSPSQTIPQIAGAPVSSPAYPSVAETGNQLYKSLPSGAIETL